MQPRSSARKVIIRIPAGLGLNPYALVHVNFSGVDGGGGPRICEHATTHLGLYYSFHMLHLVNQRPSMPAVDTATELLILHDPPSSANGLPTPVRAQLPVGWRKQRLRVSLLVLLRREIVHVLRGTREPSQIDFELSQTRRRRGTTC